MIKIKEKNSPSNIETGWRQKYFYHLESDGILDCFIKTFQNNGNHWVMRKDLFDQIIAQKNLSHWNVFSSIYNETLEIDGDFIHLRQHVAEHLLKVNWRWSFRNFLKRFKKSGPEGLLPNQ
ncbi:MAG: hypothetical protein Q8N57_00685 [bacterium]|nr:hypothetical protein [bacterium]